MKKEPNMCHFVNSFLILSLLCLVPFCARKTKIKLAGQYRQAKIPDYSILPDYYSSDLAALWNKYYPEGFHVFVFSSSRDLAELIERWGMYHLYYNLYVCGTSSDISFGGPIFPATLDNLNSVAIRERDHTYFYVAYLPVDYQGKHRLQGSLYLQKNTEALQQSGACFNIGAGRMLGPYLKSNTLKISYPRP